MDTEDTNTEADGGGSKEMSVALDWCQVQSTKCDEERNSQHGAGSFRVSDNLSGTLHLSCLLYQLHMVYWANQADPLSIIAFYRLGLLEHKAKIFAIILFSKDLLTLNANKL